MNDPTQDAPIGKQVKLKPSLWERVEAEADRRIVGRNPLIERLLEIALDMVETLPILCTSQIDETPTETSELAKENLDRWSPTTSSNTPTQTPPNTAPAEEKPQPAQ